jgi:hypothetical protein
VLRSQAPLFHLAESQIRREPGWLYKATGHRLPPISSMSCSFVNPPLAWPRSSAEAGRSHSQCNYSMVTQLRQFASRPAHDRLCLGAVCRNAIRPHSPDAWHWSITQIVEHCLPASHDGFANSCWNVWQCGRCDTPSHVFIPADVGNPEQRTRDRNHASHL